MTVLLPHNMKGSTSTNSYVQGLWPAIWGVVPHTSQYIWPNTGEIDLMELMNIKPNGEPTPSGSFSTLHFGPAWSDHNTDYKGGLGLHIQNFLWPSYDAPQKYAFEWHKIQNFKKYKSRLV